MIDASLRQKSETVARHDKRELEKRDQASAEFSLYRKSAVELHRTILRMAEAMRIDRLVVNKNPSPSAPNIVLDILALLRPDKEELLDGIKRGKSLERWWLFSREFQGTKTKNGYTPRLSFSHIIQKEDRFFGGTYVSLETKWEMNLGTCKTYREEVDRDFDSDKYAQKIHEWMNARFAESTKLLIDLGYFASS